MDASVFGGSWAANADLWAILSVGEFAMATSPQTKQTVWYRVSLGDNGPRLAPLFSGQADAQDQGDLSADGRTITWSNAGPWLRLGWGAQLPVRPVAIGVTEIYTSPPPGEPFQDGPNRYQFDVAWPGGAAPKPWSDGIAPQLYYVQVWPKWRENSSGKDVAAETYAVTYRGMEFTKEGKWVVGVQAFRVDKAQDNVTSGDQKRRCDVYYAIWSSET